MRVLAAGLSFNTLFVFDNTEPNQSIFLFTPLYGLNPKKAGFTDAFMKYD
jgi:hypothetical protein